MRTALEFTGIALTRSAAGTCPIGAQFLGRRHGLGQFGVRLESRDEHRRVLDAPQGMELLRTQKDDVAGEHFRLQTVMKESHLALDEVHGDFTIAAAWAVRAGPA